MNRRLLNILLIAFVIAAGTSYIVFRLVGARLAAPRQTTTRIVAAATDIKLGTVLRDADLTTVTKREIRRKLEDHFGVDLSTRKQAINSAIDRILLARAG